MSEWANKIQELVDGISASVAVIGYDETGSLVVSACNEDYFEMTGGRPAGVYRFPVPFDSTIPSYARRELREKIQECLLSGVAQELEQAYDLKDGTHWWRLSLKPLRLKERDSEVLDILITGLDITARMELTRQLEISTSRFRSVVDAAYDAIVTIDQQHNITLFNRAAELLFGYAQHEVIGKPLNLLIPDRFHQVHGEYLLQFAHSPVKSRQMNERSRIYGRTRDGGLIPVEIAISKIKVDGVVEFTAIIRDIADRIRLMDLLQQQAATDELTGLPNRRSFTEVAGNAFKSGSNVSLFILDIDNFKAVNDAHGHDAGDDALRALAEVGKMHSRQMDVFARLGGEEFVGVLPGTDLQQAYAIAEKLRTTIEHQSFVYAWHTGEPVPFTVSIGVATREPGETEPGTVLKRADIALYKAKLAGKNRVECESTDAASVAPRM